MYILASLTPVFMNYIIPGVMMFIRLADSFCYAFFQCVWVFQFQFLYFALSTLDLYSVSHCSSSSDMKFLDLRETTETGIIYWTYLLYLEL